MINIQNITDELNAQDACISRLDAKTTVLKQEIERIRTAAEIKTNEKRRTESDLRKYCLAAMRTRALCLLMLTADLLEKSPDAETPWLLRDTEKKSVLRGIRRLEKEKPSTSDALKAVRLNVADRNPDETETPAWVIAECFDAFLPFPAVETKAGFDALKETIQDAVNRTYVPDFAKKGG